MSKITAGLLTLLFVTPLMMNCNAQNTSDADEQIARAVLPAPPEMRDDAGVLGYDASGNLVTLREGSNDLICLADYPGDDNFHTACYHKSLEPYMARGRELRSEGKTGPESIELRHQEADAGRLEMPSEPAAVYNVFGAPDNFDPDSVKVGLYAVYIPHATEASTGIPETPGPPGTPWIMRPGTPSAHIMIVTPEE